MFDSLSTRSVTPIDRKVSADSRCLEIKPHGLWRDLIPASVLGFIFIGFLAVAYLQSGDRQERYLVMAPPSWTLGQTINLVVSVDGRFVGAGRFSNILFTTSSREDFPAALRAAGAWLVLPLPGPWGCGSPKEGGI